MPYLLRILDLHPLRDRSRRILEAVGALGDDPFEVVSADLAKKCQTVAATCFVQMIVADCFGTTAPENRSSGSLYVGPVVGDRRKLEAQRLGKVPGRDELEGGWSTLRRGISSIEGSRPRLSGGKRRKRAIDLATRQKSFSSCAGDPIPLRQRSPRLDGSRDG